jgi:hypothetical protein
LSAKGGNGSGVTNCESGGAGGGRIAVYADRPPQGVVNVSGGVAYSAARNGSDGTYYLSLPDPNNICESGNLAGTCTISNSIYLGKNITSISGVNLTLGAGATLAYSNDNDSVNLNLSGNLNLGANSSIGTSNKYFKFSNLSFANAVLAGKIYADIAVMTASGTLSITSSGGIFGNIGSPNYLVDTGMSVTALDIALGGFISADGRGFYGGYRGSNLLAQGLGPGASPSTGSSNRAGPGHGGKGGIGGTEGSGGASYDSETQPVNYGSGGTALGGTQRAGNGGGVLILNVASSYVNSGSISASGEVAPTNNYASGGAGGSIWLTVGTGASIGGSLGVLSVEGARSPVTDCAGGGGGGRIAVYADEILNDDIKIEGGSSMGVCRAGYTGTFYLDLRNLNSLCDVGDLATTCSVNTQKIIGKNLVISGTGNFEINNGGGLYTVSSAGTLSLQMGGNVSLNAGGFIGMSTKRLTISQLSSSIGDISIGGPIYADIKEMSADAVTILTGGNLYGNIGSSTNTGLIANTLTLDAGTKISADGRGELGGWQFGNDSLNGLGAGGCSASGTNVCGGGYGGNGGQGSSSANVGTAYGSTAAPLVPGSGGGSGVKGDSYGGTGGGVLRMNISGAITNNGGLSANGGNYSGASGGPGGGSGGSIWIIANSISGTGVITSNGGNGKTAAGGGGGGGRIDIDVTTTNTITPTAIGGSGYVSGIAGSSQ